ncbi:MAG: type II toxin-antitoxin system HicB family antitoxin [Bacteroidales bacterium]|nr:type II toxin-antitoxin system HicB family antitoxin [Bacteroidales bacterium]
MKKIINVLVSHSGDNFCAESKDVQGCYATGKTVEEVKKEFSSVVEFHLECLSSDGEVLPIEKDNYELEFSFTTEALLQAYKDLLSFSVLSKVTGIDQELINNYANGEKRPTKKQSDKILMGFHRIGNELLAVK